MVSPDIQLGPFYLGPLIGRGGMGHVFRGIHKGQRVPVAVKILSASVAHDREAHEGFRSEVRAVAGLDHPGIVMVFDMGTIDAAVEAQTQGQLVAGCPYLVMELAGGGALQRAWRGLSWAELRPVLLALLDALAHAHARGVIHRDLKPANVLLSAPGDIRPGVKLTDFGIAHAISDRARPGEVESAFGTPEYMSPEQFMGRWRDYGPWTDLYALGVMAWQLLAGRLPFRAAPGPDHARELAMAHIKNPVPPLVPLSTAPDKIGEWVGRLMAKDPRARFRCAAEAAWALLELERAWVPPLSYRPPSNADSALMTLAVETSGTRAASRPPVPRTWRLNAAPVPLQLQGAGLGLYGLRTIPLVGRKRERDTIWRSLSRVCEDGDARVVVLRGPAGVGKSRLAEWIAQRAEETGAATVLRALHSPIPGPGDGVPRMLASHLATGGLTGDRALARVSSTARELGIDDEHTHRSLTQIVLSSTALTADEKPLVRFGRASERDAVVQRFLTGLSAQQGVLIWMDDVQWGADALALASHLLKNPGGQPCRVLMVLTARDEALAQRPAERKALDAILEHPRSQRLDLGHLDKEEHATLVERLLHLEGDLARQVEERTAGNPLFAIQLVGDWVHRGVLEVGETGFVLKDGAQAWIPDNLFEVWSTHLARVLADHGASARDALEVAAALGQDIDSREWSTACRHLGITPPEGLIEGLAAARLARRTHSGWAFVHGMLREALERLSTAGERWPGQHLACVAMLREVYPTPTLAVHERLARHLLAADALEDALAPLLEAARGHSQQSRHQTSLELLDLRLDAMESLMLAPEDPRWGEDWRLRADIHLIRSGPPEAAPWIARLRQSATHNGWRALQAEALLLESRVFITHSELDPARVMTDEARVIFVGLGDEEGVARCHLVLGDLGYWQKALVPAQKDYEQAQALFESLGEAPGLGRAYFGLGCVFFQREEHDRARAIFESALHTARDLGDRVLEAQIHNGIAEIDRTLGDLDRAEIAYRQVARILTDISPALAAQAQLNLTYVLLARQSYEEVPPILDAIAPVLVATGHKRIIALLQAQYATCAAYARQFEAWDLHFEAARAQLPPGLPAEIDTGWALEWSGDLLALLDPDRARRAYLLARRLWAASGRDQDASRVEEALDRLLGDR